MDTLHSTLNQLQRCLSQKTKLGVIQHNRDQVTETEKREIKEVTNMCKEKGWPFDVQRHTVVMTVEHGLKVSINVRQGTDWYYSCKVGIDGTSTIYDKPLPAQMNICLGSMDQFIRLTQELVNTCRNWDVHREAILSTLPEFIQEKNWVIDPQGSHPYTIIIEINDGDHELEIRPNWSVKGLFEIGVITSQYGRGGYVSRNIQYNEMKNIIPCILDIIHEIYKPNEAYYDSESDYE